MQFTMRCIKAPNLAKPVGTKWKSRSRETKKKLAHKIVPINRDHKINIIICFIFVWGSGSAELFSCNRTLGNCSATIWLLYHQFSYPGQNLPGVYFNDCAGILDLVFIGDFYCGGRGGGICIDSGQVTVIQLADDGHLSHHF